MERMLTLLAAASLVKLAYSFPVDVKRIYDVKTVFEGFIPILGGHEGKIEVNLVVTAQGVKPAEDGAAQVLSTLDDIKVIYNGAPLPFVTIDNAKDYFPPTTISMTPFGATLKTNAPDVSLPVKLPGLDIKRFPDITYLPLQLPEGEASEGTAYSFKKAFGDSDVSYTVTPTKIGDDAVEMNISLSQTYEVLENEGKEVVKDVKDAVARVKTDMSGKGTATFDRKLGVFKIVNVTADADSTVTDLETKKASKRKVKSTLTIKLKS
jgi:hypothetical protein